MKFVPLPATEANYATGASPLSWKRKKIVYVLRASMVCSCLISYSLEVTLRAFGLSVLCAAGALLQVSENKQFFPIDLRHKRLCAVFRPENDQDHAIVAVTVVRLSS